MDNAAPAELTAWSVAIFAHNEARTIRACLEAVLAQCPQSPFPVTVLVNGSRDATARIVQEITRRHPQVRLVTLTLADKANAWNTYVHEQASSASIHFFVDGDTRPLPGAFQALADGMRSRPQARAVGALPASGRDCLGWRYRMQAFGRLAGCLYALRGEYVAALRRDGLRMPVGFIGEDLLLSCLVKYHLDRGVLSRQDPGLSFAPQARFAFRSLSPARPADWFTYWRRLVRYRIRDYQLAFMVDHLITQGRERMPRDVNALYRQQPNLPRPRWRGRGTLIDLFALMKIRASL